MTTRLARQRSDVGFHHHPDEFPEVDLGLPAELLARAGRVEHQRLGADRRPAEGGEEGRRRGDAAQGALDDGSRYRQWANPEQPERVGSLHGAGPREVVGAGRPAVRSTT